MRGIALRTKAVAAVLGALGMASVAAVPASAATPAPLDWTPCGPRGALCATLRVPLDWSRPDGTQITLALSKLPATDPAHRVGSVLFNPGGPGGEGARMVEYAGRDTFPSGLTSRFDVIGLDPRGVGGSTPTIACPVPPVDPAVTQYPTTEAGYQRFVAHNAASGQSCVQATGPLIGHVDTVSAARDIDAVRRALGEDRINWLGLSYGTLLGSIYAQLFPSHVRAMVLDGPVDHSIGSEAFTDGENVGAQDELNRLYAWCAADTSCALHGTDVRAEYRALVDRAAVAPVPAAGVPGGMTAEQIGRDTYDFLQARSAWPAFIDALRRVLAGDASEFDPSASDPGAAGAYAAMAAAYQSITCQDFPSDVHNAARLAADERRAVAEAPDARGYVEGWTVMAGCDGWPVPARDPWGRLHVTGTPPILIVAGPHDPATPYVWGLGLASQIRNSVLITRTGDGHTAFDNDDTCATDAEVGYLVDPAEARPLVCSP